MLTHGSLIEGRDRTGKTELCARCTRQAHDIGAFIAANCAGLDGIAAGSQLFGHKKGAFTGAIDDQQGLFEAAQGRGLFPTQNPAISPTTFNSTWLRVLQEKELLAR